MSTKDKRICYTIDGVPIYILHVANIPLEKNLEELQKHFLKFGALASVSYYEGLGVTKTADVYYKRPEDAAKAFFYKYHNSFAEYVGVKLTATWMQPPCAFEFGSYLYDLNDDCLLHLMSYLDSSSKIRLSFTCYRFRVHYEKLLQLGEIFNYNDVIKNIDIYELAAFLARSGRYIKRLLCEYPIQNYVDYIEILPFYCHNLEDIEFRMLTKIPFEHYSRILRTNKNLKKVDFTRCFYITDEVCLQIGHLPQLESLNLSGNYKFTGKHLDKNKNLVELTLTGTAIKTQPFVELCNEVQLKTLNIVLCNWLTKEAYQAIVDTQTQLERLVVSDNDKGRVKIVAQIKNLKHMEIMYNADTDLLSELAVYKGETLESLSVQGFKMSEITQERILKFRKLRKLSLFCIFGVENEYVDPAFLLKIAENCTELREFVCPGGTSLSEGVLIKFVKYSENLEKLNVSEWKLSDSVYENLVAVLKRRKIKPLRPVELCAYRAGISKDILKSEKYLQNRHFLKLSFINHFRRKEGD